MLNHFERIWGPPNLRTFVRLRSVPPTTQIVAALRQRVARRKVCDAFVRSTTSDQRCLCLDQDPCLVGMARYLNGDSPPDSKRILYSAFVCPAIMYYSTPTRIGKQFNIILVGVCFPIILWLTRVYRFAFMLIGQYHPCQYSAMQGSRYHMVTWVLIADLIIPSLVSLVGESPHSCWFRSIGVVWSYIGQYLDWNIPKPSWTKPICLDSYLSPPPSLQDPLVCWWFQCFEFLPIWDDNPTWLCLRKRKIRNHTCPTSIYKWS
jgi:hypothetical protein